MTKSTITRERLQELAAGQSGFNLRTATHEESQELARMALAVIDSEPVAWMVIDIDTGERIIRCDRSYIEGPCQPLYLHAQQPVVQPVMFIDGDISTEDADKLAKVIREFNEEDERPLAKMARIIRENPHPTNECDMPKAQPAPVVPDSYVMVPMRLTAENGAKGALSGEFSETKFVNCPECFGDDECETCDGSGRIEITVPVTWTTIKEIWAKGVEHFAAAPQLPGSEPATVPGKWIPVSERMPETDGNYWGWWSESKRQGPVWFIKSELQAQFQSSEITHWMPLPNPPKE